MRTAGRPKSINRYAIAPTREKYGADKGKKEEMSVAMSSDPKTRLDLHNISINFAAASRGRCGFTHLDRGWVSQLPHRHRGPCDLRPQNRVCAAAAGSNELEPGAPACRQPPCARPHPLLVKKEPTMSQQIQATPRPAQATLVPKHHLPRLRAELEQQQRFRLDQIDELYVKATLTADGARRQVMRALIMAAEWALGDINWALQRLDRGTYGTCERCTAPVPFERLNILPMARLCMPCQRHNEAAKPGGRAGR